jgi:hypothetical protein
VYSDDLESKNNPSIAAHNNKSKQGESESFSSPLTTKVYIFEDSQRSGVQTPPWAYSESVLPTEDNPISVNTPSSPSVTQQTPK